MNLSIRRKCRKIYKVIRSYWIKCFTVFFIIVTVITLILSLEHNRKLFELNNMIKAHIKKIQIISSVTSMEPNINDTWRVPDVKNAGIFAAYLDMRPEVVLEEIPNTSYKNIWALIRIITILQVDYRKTSLTCYYKFYILDSENRNSTFIMEAPALAVKIIAKTENLGMYYSAAFVICKLVTTDDGKLPVEITFSSSSGRTSLDLQDIDFVDIHYTTRTTTYNQDKFMAVCIPSLHHEYNKHLNLVEFVEFYRMMGVDHFTFYNTSVSKNVSDILRYYQNLGVATVIQWQLPKRYVFERNLRYNGIFAAMNDCLYRNTMVDGFKYIVNVDLDEFIVPRKHTNFREMMNDLDSDDNGNKIAAFIFRNMFFYLMYDDHTTSNVIKDMPKLLLYTKTTRWNTINPARDRSKYIMRGQEVIEMGNHQVWKTRRISSIFRTSYKEKIIEPSIAGLHHYRYCEVNELVCWLRETTIDVAAHRFTYNLGIRVSAVLQKLYGISVIDDESLYLRRQSM